MTADVPTKRSWGRRMLILATAVALAIAGWFVLGESESVNAAEGQPLPANPTPDQTQEPSVDRVLATVDGEPIPESRTHRAIQGQLLALERQRHELIADALEAEIRGALIASEADKRGITPDELLQIEVETKAAELPRDTVVAFHQAQAQQRGGRMPPLEQIETQIRQYLALEAFHDRLRESADVRMSLEPFRVDVAALGPAKGSPDAPVTLVLFSDFECPFCGQVKPVLDEVEKTYGDKVRIVFRQFPLEQLHPHARRAALAALCAHEQGQFWPMHDALFADQGGLKTGLETIAGRVEGIESDAFRACLADGHLDDLIARDLEDGTLAGVTGTPALFVNGRFLNGVVPFEQLARVINDELAKRG